MDEEAIKLAWDTTLTKRQAQVYVMHVIHGMSPKDVAKALGITRGSVYRIVKDAQLKILLDDPDLWRALDDTEEGTQ